MLKMLPDETERRLLSEAFPGSRNGHRLFSPPHDETTNKKVRLILNKIRKARRGPRIFRIILLLIVVGAPIGFGIVFLDSLAARYTEKTLERLLGTDVSITELDIALLQGRVEAGRIAFASMDDPMADALVLTNLLSDVDISTLAHRRLVFHSLNGTLSRNEKRDSPAVYPEKIERRRSGSSPFDPSLLTDFSWIPQEDLPTQSRDLAEELRLAAEEDYQRWRTGFEADVAEAKDLAGRAVSLTSQPLPEKQDIKAWAGRLEEARRLASDLEASANRLASQREELEYQRQEVRSASSKVQGAVESDLERIRAAMRPDRDIINRWMEAALQAYLGDSAALWYNRIQNIASRLDLKGQKDDEKSPQSRGRMKSGRIVQFPTSLPPRFSIRELKLVGDGLIVSGKNVGIDHELSGNPTELTIDSSDLDATLIIDGRSEAETLVDMFFDLSNAKWNLPDANGGLGGGLEMEGRLIVEERDFEKWKSTGRVVLGDWEGSLDFGGVQMVGADSPSLGMSYNLMMNGGNPSISLSMDDSSLGYWTSALASALLPSGMESTEKAVREGLQGDLSELDDLLTQWTASSDELDDIEKRLSGQSEQLNQLVVRLREESIGSLPELNVPDAAEGLRSLF